MCIDNELIMRRGINHKRINVTLDQETLAILDKYKTWGTPVSALIRKAVRSYDNKGYKKPQEDQFHPEETYLSYD